jgi:hypothetical protein
MTDVRPRNASARLNLSGREWKLFVIGGLGIAYAASLSLVATETQSAGSQPAGAVPTAAGAGNTVIWLDQLPVNQRPTVAPPQGWTIAAAAAQPPVSQGPMAGVTTSSTTPAAAARVPRIVTRTS